ncbi:MAG: mechanosensitive ion channel family protein [Acidobacteria bacterium]|nr:MAG: mechanosensitive ion channel family protein [Acidobacteriota bacterium]
MCWSKVPSFPVLRLAQRCEKPAVTLPKKERRGGGTRRTCVYFSFMNPGVGVATLSLRHTCYNRAQNMNRSSFIAAYLANKWEVPALLRDWHEDTMNFLRHDAPKILLVVIVSFVLIRLLRAITRRTASLQAKRLPSGLRAQQVRTLASVINSVGVFAIIFVGALMVLAQLNLHLEPLLASAGIAGLAIGFGAQTMVRDFINGFFILLENQYDLSDSVRIAGVKGTVEEMSLRRTVLRDDDGTLHMVPNGEIKIVSNMTRDWAQVSLRVAVAYSEPSERVVNLLRQVGEEVRNDPAFADDIVADIQVPGIEHVGNGGPTASTR